MGWFGYGIMDGDTPFNALDDMLGVIGYVETDGTRWDEPSDGMRWLVETKMQNVIDHIRRQPSDSQRTYWQVLAALAMEQGARLPEGAKANMLKALNEDDVFPNNLARIIYVREMTQTLQQYEGGKPTPIYGDWNKKYGLSNKDLNNPARSENMLQFLMRELAERLKCKEWFRGVQFAVSRTGYVIIVLLDEDCVEKDSRFILEDADVQRELFGMPIMFSIAGQKTVHCAGDSIFD
jgi:hypothetical protein